MPCIPLLVAITLALFVAHAAAQPVLITAPQTLDPGATTITPTAGGPPVALETADITVRGATLTVNGRYTIRSLVLEQSATLTHAPAFTFDYSGKGVDIVNGLSLEIVPNPTGGDLTIDATSRIDVTAKGFAPRHGPGAGTWNGDINCGSTGAGHGGTGGNSNCSSGGTVYGSFTQPTTMGSGGGTYADDSPTPDPRSSGGGVIRLTVNGSITLDGAIVADGGALSLRGDGAGGSICIVADTISGAGLISANGGNAGGNENFGTGGGGRVALYAKGLALPTSNVQARAGFAGTRGGPGTVYQLIGKLSPLLIYDNGGAPGVTELSGEQNFPGDLRLTNGAVISHARGDDSFAIAIGGDITIDATSRIDVTAKGFAPRQGPGAGQWNGSIFCGSSGAGHGGTGGDSNCSSGGSVYGSFTQPTMMGSGGGTYTDDSPNPDPRSSGGGVIRLTVNGSITLDGALVADGGSVFERGAGAGGSIWIVADTIVGAGFISANGGNAARDITNFGSGGGGRIALYANTLALPTSNVQARAGFAGTRGGPGTVYQVIGKLTPLLIYDNGGAPGITVLSGDQDFSGALRFTNGAVISHARGDDSLQFNVGGDLTIDATSRIDVTAKGFAPRQGPGAGQWNGIGSCGSSGAGHGGTGGDSNCSPGGSVYGSFTQPTTMGSGGGTYKDDSPNPDPRSSGGGVIRLTVDGSITLDGALVADGGTGSVRGAGAGGSIWVVAGAINGSGLISANGGNALDNFNFGSGGGGRIALHATKLTLPTANVHAHGGALGVPGGPGTVYQDISSSIPVLTYDNGGAPGATVLSGEHNFPGDLRFTNGAVITHDRGDDSLQFSVGGNLTIDATSRIDVTAKGFGPRQGPGAGTWNGDAGCGSSGAGHGGTGGDSNCSLGGSVYGSVTQPTTMGSGGGTFTDDSLNPDPRCSGGGVIRLAVNGSITLNGALVADGGTLLERGAGAGGSIWVVASAINGSGFISANGGNAARDFVYFGSGGGGRIALHACSIALSPANIRVEPGLFGSRGEPGAVHTNLSATTVRYAGAPPQCRGDSLTLIAISAAPTTFQWLRNGVDLADGPSGFGSFISGAQTAALTITNVQANDRGLYTVRVDNACGLVTSAPLNMTLCIADHNCDSVVNSTDVSDFINAWFQDQAQGSLITDWDGNGVVNSTDVSSFINSWFEDTAAGCG